MKKVCAWNDKKNNNNNKLAYIFTYTKNVLFTWNAFFKQDISTETEQPVSSRLQKRSKRWEQVAQKT